VRLPGDSGIGVKRPLAPPLCRPGEYPPRIRQNPRILFPRRAKGSLQGVDSCLSTASRNCVRAPICGMGSYRFLRLAREVLVAIKRRRLRPSCAAASGHQSKSIIGRARAMKVQPAAIASSVAFAFVLISSPRAAQEGAPRNLQPSALQGEVSGARQGAGVSTMGPWAGHYRQEQRAHRRGGARVEAGAGSNALGQSGGESWLPAGHYSRAIPER